MRERETESFNWVKCFMPVITAPGMLRQGDDSDLLGYVVSEVRVRSSLSN